MKLTIKCNSADVITGKGSFTNYQKMPMITCLWKDERFIEKSTYTKNLINDIGLQGKDSVELEAPGVSYFRSKTIQRLLPVLILILF